MRLVLFSLPTIYYEQPQGIPRLVPYLRDKGYDVVHKNLNYEFYKEIFSYPYLKNIISKPNPGEISRLLTNDKIKRISEASFSLDNSYGSLSYSEFSQNSNILSEGCQIIAAAYPGSRISLETGLSMSYSEYSSAQIVAAIQDEHQNMFSAYCREAVLPWLDQVRADIVGLSITHMNQLIPALTLAAMIKQISAVPIVIGGAVIGQLGEFFLKTRALHEYFDYAVIGSGEIVLDQLLQTLKHQKKIELIPNLLFKRKGRLTASKYWTRFNIINAHIPEFIEPRPKPVINLETSQNCYWGKCAFCDRQLDLGSSQAPHAYNTLTLEKTIQALNVLQEKHDPLYFRLTDQAISPKRLQAITQAIKTSNLNIKIFAYIRAEPEFTSREFCQELVAGGLVATAFGLESAEQTLNDKYNKGIRVENVEKIIKNFSSLDIATCMFSIVNFPAASAEEILKTEAFIKKNQAYLDSVVVFPFALFHNTLVFKRPKQFGITQVKKIAKQDINRFYGFSDKSQNVQKLEYSQRLINQHTPQKNQTLLSVLKNRDRTKK